MPSMSSCEVSQTVENGVPNSVMYTLALKLVLPQCRKNFSKKWKDFSIALPFSDDSNFVLVATQASSSISNPIGERGTA